jgi:drug/metabolite transporter (DMT)-like permease
VARPRILNLSSGALGMVFVGASVGISQRLTTAPLFTAQAIRYGAAALLLLAWSRATHAPIQRPRGREWLWLAGVAASGLVLFNVAIVRGDAHAEPAVIAVAVACVPVLLGVLGPLLERRRPRGAVVLAGLLVTAGAVLVAGAGHTDGIGIGWAVLALACEAGFTLLAVPVLPRHGAGGVSVHSVWIGTAMFAVLALATEGPRAASRLSGTELLADGYLAVFVTAAAFVLWYSAVAALGSDRVGLLTGIAPVSAAITGMLLGLRTPGPSVWAGIAVVVLGLAAGLSARPAARPSRAEPCAEPSDCADVSRTLTPRRRPVRPAPAPSRPPVTAAGSPPRG